MTCYLKERIAVSDYPFVSISCHDNIDLAEMNSTVVFALRRLTRFHITSTKRV
jgi:hypothetical protein